VNWLIAAAKAFFLRGEEGVSLVEYGLLLAFVAAICVAAITAFGTVINNAFGTFAGTI
jgi:pilus assembly protein Flp/PilA